MAYPFAQAPTVEQLKATAVELGCSLEPIKVTGPRGSVIIEVLVRLPDGDGKILISESLPSIDERIAPDTLRRICRQLGLPTKLFGYDLDWMNDDPDDDS